MKIIRIVQQNKNKKQAAMLLTNCFNDFLRTILVDKPCRYTKSLFIIKK